nr:MAG: hypothetical protein [Molluscum contagiosum virus]
MPSRERSARMSSSTCSGCWKKTSGSSVTLGSSRSATCVRTVLAKESRQMREQKLPTACPCRVSTAQTAAPTA